MWHAREKRDKMLDFDGKARRKVTIRKTKA
jgi:hypothetical protein